MLLKDVRTVLRQMGNDPKIASELPIVGSYIKKTLGWMVLTELYMAVQVFPLKYFIDEISSGHARSGRLLAIVASFLLIYEVGSLLARPMEVNRIAVYWGGWRTWWGYGNRCILNQSDDWHTAHSTGEKDSLVGRNVTKFQSLFDEALFATLPAALRIFFTTILMFFIHWTLGIVSVFTCLVFALFMRHVEKQLAPLREVFQEDMKKAEDSGSELAKNWQTIRALGLEDKFSDDNDELLRGIWTREIARFIKNAKYELLQRSIINVARAVLYGTLALLVIRAGGSLGTAGLSVGGVSLAITWMERSFSNFGRFEDFQRQMNAGKEALKELVEFIQLEPTIRSPRDPCWPEKVEGSVVFDHVNFSYPEATSNAIHDFSLAVTPYTTTAFVGPSGCGKTTLMMLLGRGRDPDSGSIKIDGIDLRDYDYGRYRSEMVAAVNQTVQLFNRSIAFNIGLGKRGATHEEVVEAAKLAGIHEFIMGTSHGYDTMVGDDGIRLSGGQKQRLAIARALIRKPAILIMDEATSSLDAKVQDEVQANLNMLMASRTCTIFVIAHRLSTVMTADRVVVIEAGSISAIGTHDELQRMNGLYKELCDLELKRGILD